MLALSRILSYTGLKTFFIFIILKVHHFSVNIIFAVLYVHTWHWRLVGSGVWVLKQWIWCEMEKCLLWQLSRLRQTFARSVYIHWYKDFWDIILLSCHTRILWCLFTLGLVMFYILATNFLIFECHTISNGQYW